MRIQLTTLPRLSCRVGDRELTALPGQRRRAAVLIVLAVERKATRDALVEMFWPDRPPGDQRGRRALAQTFYEIGQDLQTEWFDSVGELVEVRPEIHVDAVAFVDAVKRRAWTEALGLYHGPFLHGLGLVDTTGFNVWLDQTRYHLEGKHRVARKERIRELREAGDLEAALAAATVWSEIDPVEDEAHQRIIELSGLLGRAAEAKRQFAAYEQILRLNGDEPMEEMRAILEQALADSLAFHRARSSAQNTSPRSTAPAKAGEDPDRPGGGSQSVGAETGRPGTPQRRPADPPPPAEASPRAGSGLHAEEPGRRSPAPFPELLPDLEVLYPIGEGSVARVYVAREPALDRMVAIKVLSPDLADDAVARQRFEREARSAARIHHPNVAAVHRTGQLKGGVPFFVMPYVDGGTLEHRLRAAGALPIEEARALIRQVAAGLAAAHALRIVHRDVKPSNILFDRATRRALLADFGLAAVLESGTAARERLTRTNERLGNPVYVSPEQLRGDVLTERTDVYALGVVAFELLTGRLPFDADGPAEQIRATLGGRPHDVATFRPETPADLAELVRRCLALRYEHRPFAADVAAGS